MLALYMAFVLVLVPLTMLPFYNGAVDCGAVDCGAVDDAPVNNSA